MSNPEIQQRLQKLLPDYAGENITIIAESQAANGVYLVFDIVDDETGGSYLVFLGDDDTAEVLAADTTIFPINIATVPLENRNEIATQVMRAELAAGISAEQQAFIVGATREGFPDDLARAWLQEIRPHALQEQAVSFDLNINQRIYQSALFYENKLDSSKAPGTSNGTRACAWAVNYVVTQAIGKPVGGDLSTAEMAKALAKGRGHPVTASTVSPGSIIISPTEKTQIGHVGIVGENGKVYSNSSSKKLWVQNYSIRSWRERYEQDKKLKVLFYDVVKS